jgi:hypothetical protein
MNIRAAAFDAIPRYTRTVAGAELAKKYRNGDPNRNTNSLEPAMADAVREAEELIAAGEDIPLSLGEKLEAAERADRAMQLRSIAVQRASAALRIDLDEVVQDGYEHAYAVLGRHLDELVAEVQDLAPHVAGIRDTYDAQQKGDSNWARLLHLVTEYDEIRSTQLEIFQLVDTDRSTAARRFGTFGLYADAHDVTPLWQRLRSNAARNSEPQNDLGRAYIDWLRDDKSDKRPASLWLDQAADVEPALTWWGSGDRAAELIWIATTTHPWIPTVDQVNSAYDAATASVRRVARIPIPAMLEARHRLHTVTGIPDTHSLPTTLAVHDAISDNGVDIMRKPSAEGKRITRKITDAAARADSQRAHREQSAALQRTRD